MWKRSGWTNCDLPLTQAIASVTGDADNYAFPSSRFVRLAVLASFVLLSAHAQGQVPPRFRTETDLVYLTVTVADRNGKPVSGLRASDFRVYENNIEQQVRHFEHEGMPLTIGLVLDSSGSMRHMIGEVYEAPLHVIQDAGPEDEIFLMTFSDRVRLAQELTRDKEKFMRRSRVLRQKAKRPCMTQPTRRSTTSGEVRIRERYCVS